MSEVNERKAAGFYRNYLEREIIRPEIRLEKEKFIRTHFWKEPALFLTLTPGFTVPALCLTLVFCAFLLFQAPPTPNPFGRAAVFQKPQVEVRRAASKTGAIMVYQKVYNGAPFTIVWVFSGGTLP